MLGSDSIWEMKATRLQNFVGNEKRSWAGAAHHALREDPNSLLMSGVALSWVSARRGDDEGQQEGATHESMRECSSREQTNSQFFSNDFKSKRTPCAPHALIENISDHGKEGKGREECECLHFLPLNEENRYDQIASQRVNCQGVMMDGQDQEEPTG